MALIRSTTDGGWRLRKEILDKPPPTPIRNFREGGINRHLPLEAIGFKKGRRAPFHEKVVIPTAAMVAVGGNDASPGASSL